MLILSNQLNNAIIVLVVDFLQIDFCDICQGYALQFRTFDWRNSMRGYIIGPIGIGNWEESLEYPIPDKNWLPVCKNKKYKVKKKLCILLFDTNYLTKWQTGPKMATYQLIYF